LSVCTAWQFGSPNCVGLRGASRGGAWCDPGMMGHEGSLDLPSIII